MKLGNRFMKFDLTSGSLCLALIVNCLVSGANALGEGFVGAPEGWSTGTPRDEISPQFKFEADGGVDGKGCFLIGSDAREGLDGWWTKTFPVTGAKYYRCAALYKCKSVALPRRSIVLKLDWQDAQGHSVPLDEPTVASYLRGETGTAETE